MKSQNLLTAKDAKGLRKERKMLIDLRFATFAKKSLRSLR